jgi:hypothetical protein
LATRKPRSKRSEFIDNRSKATKQRATAQRAPLEKKQKTAPEGELLKTCLAFLQANRIKAWRQNSGAMVVGSRFIRFSHIEGISDIIGIWPDGRFLAIETKVRPRKATPHQAAFLQMIRDNGGIAEVIYSLQELEDLWKRERKGRNGQMQQNRLQR